jgi:hypothetical protein
MRGSALAICLVVVGLCGGGVVASCVFPGTPIGQECRDSSSCEQDRVCLPLDPAHPEGNAACLPMPSVEAPVSCSSVDDCEKVGFPVDATCVDKKCGCPTITCDSDQKGDAASCLCVDLPDAGTNDDDDATAT